MNGIRSGSEVVRRLSARESEILSLLTLGLSSKQISTHLCLSKYTVDNYRRRLLRKLGAPNTAAAVAFSLGNGSTHERESSSMTARK